MGNVYSKEFVKFILEKMQECVAVGDFVILPRDINTDFISEYAITKEKQKEILLGITAEDYCESDPSERVTDRIENPFDSTKTIRMYVKFEIVEKQYGSRTVFISFHEASYPLQFPFRTQVEFS